LALAEQERGPAFTILVPGPDAAIGDPEYLDVIVFLVKRFMSLVAFNEFEFIVHEDCAGCVCCAAEHEQRVWKLARSVAKAVNFKEEVRCFISRQPVGDQYGAWPMEEVFSSEKAQVAAE